MITLADFASIPTIALTAFLAVDLRLVNIDQRWKAVVCLVWMLLVAAFNVWINVVFADPAVLAFTLLTVLVPLFIVACFFLYYPDARIIYSLCIIAFICFSVRLITFAVLAVLNVELEWYYFFVNCLTAFLVGILMHIYATPGYVELQRDLPQGWGVYSVVPIIGMLAIIICFASNAAGGYRDIIVPGVLIVCIMGIVFVVFFKMFRQIQDRYTMESDLKLLRSQQVGEQRLASEREQHEAEMRRQRHDQRHAIQLMIDELDAGNIEELRAQLVEMRGGGDAPEARFCENSAVNSTLSWWSYRAQDVGIDVTIRAAVPKNLEIDALELTTALSNLLENAYEACLRLEKSETHRFIDVKIRCKDGRMVCKIVNSCRKDVRFVDDMPQTQKRGGGIGTQSVVATATAHDGFVRYSMEDGIFTTRLVMAV